MSNTLYAGVARRVINPAIGTTKGGLRLFADPIQAIESDLTGTVLVLSNQSNKVAIIALDLCVFSPAEGAAIREQVGGAIGIPSTNVMVNLSHNHSSPTLPDWFPDTEEQTRLKTRYRDQLTEWLVEAVREADSSLRPARIGAGWGESQVAVYRRETGPDGRDVLGEVPDHPIDPAVGVIRVDDLDGNPIAVAFSYGCHPVTVGPRSMVASTDFPGPARDVIEKCLGGTALFLQSCGGNINPRVGIGYEVDCRDAKNRMGLALGGEALRVAAEIRTNVQPGERAPMGNVPNILFNQWQPVEGDTCTYLGTVEETVKLSFCPLPPMEQAKQIHDHWQDEWEKRKSGNARDWEVRIGARFTDWSEKLVAAIEDGNPSLDLELQGIRVNDIVLVGMNTETFFETGLSIRSRSPLPHTFVLGYTNSLVSYLPRAEDHPKGGWKFDESYAVPDLLFQCYSLPVALHPDSAELAVERASALIQRLG
jgi:neutral ceramidase